MAMPWKLLPKAPTFSMHTALAPPAQQGRWAAVKSNAVQEEGHCARTCTSRSWRVPVTIRTTLSIMCPYVQ